MVQTEEGIENHRDEDLLRKWHQFASSQPGFIGDTLRKQRLRYVQTEEQQRAQVGIPGSVSDPIWIYLQGMPLPRNGADFESDVIRIARYVEQQALSRFRLTVAIDHRALEKLLTDKEEITRTS